MIIQEGRAREKEVREGSRLCSCSQWIFPNFLDKFVLVLWHMFRRKLSNLLQMLKRSSKQVSKQPARLENKSIEHDQALSDIDKKIPKILSTLSSCRQSEGTQKRGLPRKFRRCLPRQQSQKPPHLVVLLLCCRLTNLVVPIVFNAILKEERISPGMWYRNSWTGLKTGWLVRSRLVAKIRCLLRGPGDVGKERVDSPLHSKKEQDGKWKGFFVHPPPMPKPSCIPILIWVEDKSSWA